MQRKLKKKKVLLRTGKKKKKATISIHRTKHRAYRKVQAGLERYLKQKEKSISAN